MPDEKIMQRLRYQKKKAKDRFGYLGAEIINSDNHIICFEANFTTHEDKVRVILDEFRELDFEQMKRVSVKEGQSRIVWCGIKNVRDPYIVDLTRDLEVRIRNDPFQRESKGTLLSIPQFLEKAPWQP